MRKIFKLLLLALVFGSFTFQSCETTELELTNDPNNITSGDPQFLLNNIQRRYRTAQSILSDRAAELTRIDNFNGQNYLASLPDIRLNTPWSVLYSDIIPDVQAIEAAVNETTPLSHHLGMAKILQAHLTMQLVDFLGDIIVPEQAGKPNEFPNPMLTTDGGLTNYNHSIALLDEAIVLLNSGATTATVQDLFYGDNQGNNSSAEKWIKLANTLKMRAALTTGDMTTFNNLVAAGNYITDTADDFQFRFGTQQTPVNTMHPDYQTDYTPSGSAIYHSNWLMYNMSTNNDPRIRYYFYRQNACTPGASCNPAGEASTLTCSTQPAPAHIQGTPTEAFWCALENGYWGRLHREDGGAPPDEFSKTAAGVYPAGGLFDDDAFGAEPRNLTLGAGGNGAGIEPIILASYVDFWRAEVALGQGNVSSAAQLMSNGLTKSIAKVSTFAALDANNPNLSFEPTAAAITSYINTMSSNLTAAGNTEAGWNILSEQYFVTLFGGGTDSYNYYRRTGYPTTVGTGFSNDASAGNFPRTFLYPSNEASSNPNVIQRTNLDTATFWNTQPLPSAN